MLAKVLVQQHEANLSRDTVKIRDDSSKDNMNIMDDNNSRTTKI
jgi:hypothetical protein